MAKVSSRVPVNTASSDERISPYEDMWWLVERERERKNTAERIEELSRLHWKTVETEDGFDDARDGSAETNYVTIVDDTDEPGCWRDSAYTDRYFCRRSSRIFTFAALATMH